MPVLMRNGLGRRGLLARAAGMPALGVIGAACAVGSGGGPAGEVAPKAQLRKGAKIVYAIDEQGGAARQELRMAQVKLFQDKFPDIEVELLRGATGTEKLVSLFAAGTPPDYFRQSVRGMMAFIMRNQVLALDPYMKRDKYDLSDFFPSAWEQYRWKGRYYAVPFLGLQIWFYNRAVLQSAGAARPPGTWRDPSWTWDAFLAACQKVVERGVDENGNQTTTRWGVSLNTGARGWGPWIWSNGGDVFSADGTKLVFDQPPAIEAVQFMADLIHKHRLALSIPEAQARGGFDALFTAGRVGFQNIGLNSVIAYRRQPALAWGLTGAPRGKGKTTASSGGGGWFIAADSKVRDETWEFGKVMVSPEAQRLEAKDSTVASRRSVMNDPTIVNTNDPPGPEIKTLAEALELLRIDTPLLNGTEIDTILDTHFEAIWTGKQGVTQAISAAAAQIKPLLNPPG